jgi:hypothetical protein
VGTVLRAFAHPTIVTDPSETCAMFMRYFGLAAESQALFRAFFAERYNGRPTAQF